jgi:hypothetical protein
VEDASFTLLWWKFQLILAYGALQMQVGVEGRDLEWMKAVAETLPQIVRDVFEQQGTEASMYQRLLENQIVGWRQAMNTTS